MGKDGNVLFNDTLNTFHLRLYGVEHMVKDYEDSQRGNSTTPLHGLRLSTSGKGSFTRTSCGALAGTRNSSMGPP